MDLQSRYRHSEYESSPTSLSQILTSLPQESTSSTYDTISTSAVSSSISSTPSDSNQPNPSSIEARRVEQTPAEKKSRASDPLTAIPEEQNASGKWIRGVFVEKRPPPPGPEDCCMSGCAHCVYDIYAEDFVSYKQSLKQSKEKLLSLVPAIDPSDWDVCLLGQMTSSADVDRDEGDGKDEARRERDTAEKEIKELEEGLDPVMKGFLAMERKMKKKEREKQK